MLGNDLVDIEVAYAQKSWRQERFRRKVFTPSECAFIGSSDNEFKSIWRMWSMKESAYKVAIQRGVKRFLNPQKLNCVVIDEKRGMVEFDSHIFNTHTMVGEDYIFTTCSDLDTFVTEDHLVYVNRRSEQSLMTRRALLERIAEKYKYNLNDLQIKKCQQGIPKLYFKEKPLEVSFSLTHHGKFGAYSIEIN